MEHSNNKLTISPEFHGKLFHRNLGFALLSLLPSVSLEGFTSTWHLSAGGAGFSGEGRDQRLEDETAPPEDMRIFKFC